MKRKLVKQGRNALTVTLPAEWSRANKLAAGDEVEVLQEGRNIMITPEEVKEAELKVEYDITGLDRSSIVLLYTSLYESGVDEVRFRFSKDSTTDHKTGSKAAFSDIITAYTLRFEGFAVVEQGKGYYIIKDISNQSEKDFDAVLRRVFLLLLNFHEQMIEGLETNQPLTSKKADELH
ncbi:AbrB/MazE/SpoVT family DNA-binding domain-containing protein, partial [Candidatus Woesearchaeota archaeon]|nr:AbrB/MazE/SpoVT family DNA-binding domain-containing protein [Candidatus Woesearchaeota archaeon]